MNTLEIILTAIGTAVTVVSATAAVMGYFFRRERKEAINDTRIDAIERNVGKIPGIVESLADHGRRIDAIEKNVEKIPEIKETLAEHGRQFESIGKDIAVINARLDKVEDGAILMRADMASMKTDMSTIKGILCMKFPDISDFFSAKHSPRRLNSTGVELFKSIAERRS